MLVIRLDPEGQPHWLLYWQRIKRRRRGAEIFQRLNTLQPGAVGAEELTPEERPFLSTSTRGSAPTGLPDHAASGPEAPRSPCSSFGDEPTRPGFVGFVGDSRGPPCGAQRGGETKPNRLALESLGERAKGPSTSTACVQ